MDSEAVDLATKATYSLGEFLFRYGPWGVCTVLFFLLVALYIHMSRKNARDRKELGDLLEKRNNQMLVTVQRCINAMTASTETIKEAKVVIHENTELLNKMKRIINRCEYAPKPKGGEDE